MIEFIVGGLGLALICFILAIFGNALDTPRTELPPVRGAIPEAERKALQARRGDK